MLGRVKAALAARRGGGAPEPAVDHAAEAHAFLSARIAGMAPVEPGSPPANDDPLAGAVPEVERSLRAAGYLR